MIVFGLESTAKATAKRAEVNGAIFNRASWMEEPGQGGFRPTAVLIHQPPNAVLPAHFHRENQFQLFVRGAGTIGAHTLQAHQVHYAGAYTGYGPITAGPEGLSYMTLRAQFDTGAGFLPNARKAMVQGPKRHAVSKPFDPAQSSQGGITELIGSGDDGIYAASIALAPGERTELAQCAQGQFVVVLEGSLLCEGRTLSGLEHVFFADQQLEFTAGSNGCHLAVMRIPALEEEYAAATRPADEMFAVAYLPPVPAPA